MNSYMILVIRGISMVRRIIPGHMEGSEMTVVKGANPEQYPSYDEEEW